MTFSIAKTVASVLQLRTHQTDGRPQIQEQSKYGNYFSRMTARTIVLLHIYNLGRSFFHVYTSVRTSTHELSVSTYAANALLNVFVLSHDKRHVGNESNITKNYRS